MARAARCAPPVASLPAIWRFSTTFFSLTLGQPELVPFQRHRGDFGSPRQTYGRMSSPIDRGVPAPLNPAASSAAKKHFIAPLDPIDHFMETNRPPIGCRHRIARECGYASVAPYDLSRSLPLPCEQDTQIVFATH